MLCKICVKPQGRGSLPGGCSFFWQQKKEPKKTAAVSTQRTRDLEAARPLDSQSGSRRGRGLRERSITVRAYRPRPLLRFKIRVFPRTPAAVNLRYIPFPHRRPVGAGHARPAALRQLPVSLCAPLYVTS